MPATFTYEPGMVVAEGDLVMIHGRYSGWRPKPMIAVDIFRVKDGKLVEHWDVLQEKCPPARRRAAIPCLSRVSDISSLLVVVERQSADLAFIIATGESDTNMKDTDVANCRKYLIA